MAKPEVGGNKPVNIDLIKMAKYNRVDIIFTSSIHDCTCSEDAHDPGITACRLHVCVDVQRDLHLYQQLYDCAKQTVVLTRRN